MGPYYVDRECIDCDLCRHHAPRFFDRDDLGAHSFVIRQPETTEEVAICEEALDGCPVEAIGNNGQSCHPEAASLSRFPTH